MQPNSLGQFKVISGTAAGTTVITNRGCGIYRIYIPANRTGTVSLYDCSTAAGTTASNAITDIACTVGSIPVSIEMGFNTHDGLTAVTGGTTNLLIAYE